MITPLIKRHYILFFIFLTYLFCASQSIAIVSKAKGNVKYKKKEEKELKNSLKSGIDLHNNDYIRTGKDGFAKYVYLDDGTQIKIHNNSEVYIRGEIDRRSIIKQLKVDEGTVKLDIKKQAVDEFTVITPTSVASVKGTSFWLDCSGNGGDKFYGESGIVSIQNRESGQKKSLVKNTVASSLPDGTINIRKMTQNELQMLEQIEDDSGESQENNDESGDFGAENEIIIELEDEFGNQKTITIKIK